MSITLFVCGYMCREHTASIRVRAPSTSVTESTQHMLAPDAGAAAESQVSEPVTCT